MKRVRRLLAFLAQETFDIARQPLLLIVLILGPFLILLLFGIGYTGKEAPVRIIAVIPSNAQVPPDFEGALLGMGPSFPVTITDNAALALADLQAGKADLVGIVPPRTQDTLLSGNQIHIKLLIDEVNPMRADYLSFVAHSTVEQLNRLILRQTMQQILASSAYKQIAPDILAQPIVTELQNIARYKPDYMGFYAPAVLALLIQHVAVTFAALSLVRDRTQGINEFYQVSPLTPSEALAGKFMAYMLMTLGIGAVLLVLIVKLLGVPLFGSLGIFVLVLALEVGASLGWGFLISAISQREVQAVQLSMILLLASVFFSGFFLDIAGLIPGVRVLSYSLPVTYAITSFQDIMLRGQFPVDWHLLALAALTMVFTFAAWLIYRRQFRLF